MKRESRGIQSIEVGGELLRALARSGEPMMLRDLAREAGMTPAKAHPYLASFSRIGLIEPNACDGAFDREVQLGESAHAASLVTCGRCRTSALEWVRCAQPPGPAPARAAYPPDR